MPSAEPIPESAAQELRHLALVGPTASGKTELAVQAARELGDVEVVMADAMCVYRGMDIGTAKPTPEQQAGIAHHLIDVADPEEDYSIARFQRDFTTCLGEIEARGNRALLVGGSGLYVRAAVDGLVPPPRFPGERARLEVEADTTRLHDRLRDLDPQAASRMEPTNRRRVLRALEVTLGSGKRFSEHGASLADYPPTRFRQVGIWMPRSRLSGRIQQRYADQMAAGFLDEARRLHDRTPSISRTAAQALGYKELFAHLRGEAALDVALERAVSRTRAFARRQRVWFRRDPRICWLGTAGDPLTLLPPLLGDWERR